MRPGHPLIKWLRLITLSGASTRVRCNVSGMAATLEFLIFLALINDWFHSQTNILAWCCVLALVVGLTSGTFALSGARNRSDRFAALVLLAFQFFALLVLLLIGIIHKLQMGAIPIH